MATEKSTAPPANGGAAATTAAAPTKKQQPSLYARKLIQKVSTLHPNASLESRQTIAAWMVFNRKKCEGMGEGLLLAIKDDTTAANDGSAAARLMLLVRIIHQVFILNCPGVEDDGDADNWEKSSQLRSRLGEVAIMPLWKALATSFETKLNDDATMMVVDQYQSEIKGMIEEWREHNVFGGPTILEEYKKGWNRVLKEVADERSGGGESSATTVSNPIPEGAATENTSTSKSSSEVDDLPLQTDQSSAAEESNQIEETEDVNEENIAVPEEGVNETQENIDTSDADAIIDNIPAPLAVDDNGDGKTVPSLKRDSIAAPDVEVDFEGVEEAKVEPSQFLDACKVIASIQITRDLGSDAAMNISSALTGIPSEVKDACSTILMQQQKGEDGTPIADLLSTDKLSNLPDEVLDLDIKYARQSLQTYKEAIRQQRKARLQCLQLLLQSRCSFGSMDAARVFCSGEVNDTSMDTILDKLKKRKEILVDAMALEGLDVEEDDEEKNMENEEDSLKPMSWFPGQEEEGTEEERAAKKLKSS